MSRASSQQEIRDQVVYVNSKVDSLCVALRMSGRSYKCIMNRTGLTFSQAQYRVHKLEKKDTSLKTFTVTLADGRKVKRRETYFSTWKDGTSPIARAYDHAFMGKIVAAIRREAPKLHRWPVAYLQGS